MPKCPFTVPVWHWRRTSATWHLGTSSCNTFGAPLLLLTNFWYTRSSCTSNASQLLQSFFVSSDSPSISSFVVFRYTSDATARFGSIRGPIVAVWWGSPSPRRFLLIPMKSLHYFGQSNSRSADFRYLVRLPQVFGSNLRRCCVDFRFGVLPNLPRIVISSLFWRLIRTRVGSGLGPPMGLIGLGWVESKFANPVWVWLGWVLFWTWRIFLTSLFLSSLNELSQMPNHNCLLAKLKLSNCLNGV